MLAPFVGVTISASRSVLAKDISDETQSSRVIINPPEIFVPLTSSASVDDGLSLEPFDDASTTDSATRVHENVARLKTNYITVEGGAETSMFRSVSQQSTRRSASESSAIYDQLSGRHPTTSGGSAMSRRQFNDSVVSAIVNKVRCGDEVITVLHGASGCGKTSSLLGAAVSPPSDIPDKNVGIFFDVIRRLFGMTRSANVACVELGVSIVEFRALQPLPTSDQDDSDTWNHTASNQHLQPQEEAYDLLRDAPDAVTPSRYFSASPDDFPLAESVLCKDEAEVITTLLVALSRSKSWAAAGSSRDRASTSLEIPTSPEESQRMLPAASRSSLPPLVPTKGSTTHLNINITTRITPQVTAELKKAAAPPVHLNETSNEETARFEKLEKGNVMGIAKPIIGLWRVFDLVGPELFDFDADDVAAMAQSTHQALVSLVGVPGPNCAPSILHEHNRQYFVTANSNLCARVIASSLRCGAPYVVWIAAMRLDYVFDVINADVLRLANWIQKFCGRGLNTADHRDNVRQKHLHVAETVLECHAVTAKRFFERVLQSKKTAGSICSMRYASLAHRLASLGRDATAVIGTRRQADDSAKDVSPQSISFSGDAADGGATTVSSDGDGRTFATKDKALQEKRLRQRKSSPVKRQQFSLDEPQLAPSSLEGEGDTTSPEPSPALNSTQPPLQSRPLRKPERGPCALEDAPMTRQLPTVVAGSAKQKSAEDCSTEELVNRLEERLAKNRRSAAEGHDEKKISPAVNLAAVAAKAAVTAPTRRPLPQADTVTQERKVKSMLEGNEPHSWQQTLRSFSAQQADQADKSFADHRQLDKDPTVSPVEQDEGNKLNKEFAETSRGGTQVREFTRRPLALPRNRVVHDATLKQRQGDDSHQSASSSRASSSKGAISEREQEPLVSQQIRSVFEKASVSPIDERPSIEPDATVAFLKEQVVSLKQELLALKSTKQEASDAMAAMIAPVVEAFEAETARLRACLLKQEVALEPPASWQAAADDRDETNSVYFDNAVTDGSGFTTGTNRSVSWAENASVMDVRKRALLAKQSNYESMQSTAASQLNNTTSLPSTDHQQKRIRYLELQLVRLHQQNTQLKKEMLDASQRNIHSEAFRKILNDSGLMFAKLQKSMQRSRESHREDHSKAKDLTQRCLRLEEDLLAARTSEGQLRSLVSALQKENIQQAKVIVARNAATRVSSILTNASAGDKLDDISRSGNTSRPGVRKDGGGSLLFDAYLDDDISNDENVATMGAAYNRDASSQCALVLPDFERAVKKVIEASQRPLREIRRGIEGIAATEQRMDGRGAPTAAVAQRVEQSTALLQLLKRVEEKEIQLSLHLDTLREESQRVGRELMLSAQRERQYLNTILSK